MALAAMEEGGGSERHCSAQSMEPGEQVLRAELVDVRSSGCDGADRVTGSAVASSDSLRV